MQGLSYFIFLFILAFHILFIQTSKISDFIKSCRQHSTRQTRHLDEASVMLMNQNSKPCCLPKVWRARFRVQTVKGGRYLSRLDHGAFHINHNDDGTVNNALLVVGKHIYSTDFCSINKTLNSMIVNHLCPNDTIRCLNTPFIGEPRCITEKDGYMLKKTKRLHERGQIKQIWYIDKFNEIFGNVERHLYYVLRQSGLCKLLRYQIQWGKYTMPWKNCRLFIKREQTYIPINGTFQQHFNHSLMDDLLFC
ncbi:unnamed protein product [Trichobilharzia regenti]|uniref:Uncharacterized protein n=1 Tax=Trichobilharzia regenti TaxID=157069 RepID=A0A183VJ22_TRIRE|nr:unnamed protein product [Trichobilharzia regenti]VDP94365.1 unnamed protein product [Trichobilharzia regenti]